MVKMRIPIVLICEKKLPTAHPALSSLPFVLHKHQFILSIISNSTLERQNIGGGERGEVRGEANPVSIVCKNQG